MEEKKELKVDDIKKEAEANACPVQKSLLYIQGFLEGPMCGRCFPCAMGSYEARVRLSAIKEGHGSAADLAALKRIAGEMLEASMCKKGKDTARFLAEWMASPEFGAHITGRVCQTGQCISYVEYRVNPDRCTVCGSCKDVCRHGAIFGEKKKPWLSGYLPFEIRQKKCTRCGECIKVCPEGAIFITNSAAGQPEGKAA
ncbi:MAG: 4Fe-4S binding protein [Actinomycetota bacterium]|nr:4Fe-4S binding protein [Actinomycetota bacterium]